MGLAGWLLVGMPTALLLGLLLLISGAV